MAREVMTPASFSHPCGKSDKVPTLLPCPPSDPQNSQEWGRLERHWPSSARGCRRRRVWDEGGPGYILPGSPATGNVASTPRGPKRGGRPGNTP